MPSELRKLRTLVAKGLAATDALWPAIRIAYDWVHQAARLLENEDALTGREVRQQLEELLAEIRDGQATVGVLQPAVAHFLKVSASYWPGLFHCYDVPGLPRTDNDLEHVFGSQNLCGALPNDDTGCHRVTGSYPWHDRRAESPRVFQLEEFQAAGNPIAFLG